MMKQRIGLAVVVSVMALSILACQVGGFTRVRGSGNIVEEGREVSGFTGVALAGIGELTIEVGERESLRIEAEDNLMTYLETEVRNGMLEIGVQDGVNLNSTRPVRFYLTVKELDTIVLSGSGDIKAPDLEAERFSVTISGSGDVEMGDLSADTLDVVISGSGNLDIAGGRVGEQDITISQCDRLGDRLFGCADQWKRLGELLWESQDHILSLRLWEGQKSGQSATVKQKNDEKETDLR
jgi:hypothetical protein